MYETCNVHIWWNKRGEYVMSLDWLLFYSLSNTLVLNVTICLAPGPESWVVKSSPVSHVGKTLEIRISNGLDCRGLSLFCNLNHSFWHFKFLTSGILAATAEGTPVKLLTRTIIGLWPRQLLVVSRYLLPPALSFSHHHSMIMSFNFRRNYVPV